MCSESVTVNNIFHHFHPPKVQKNKNGKENKLLDLMLSLTKAVKQVSEGFITARFLSDDG